MINLQVNFLDRVRLMNRLYSSINVLQTRRAMLSHPSKLNRETEYSACIYCMKRLNIAWNNKSTGTRSWRLFCGARRAVFTPESPRIPAAELELAGRRVASPRYFSKHDRDKLQLLYISNYPRLPRD